MRRWGWIGMGIVLAACKPATAPSAGAADTAPPPAAAIAFTPKPAASVSPTPAAGGSPGASPAPSGSPGASASPGALGDRPLDDARGLAAGADGLIYVWEAGARKIVRLGADGRFADFAGGPAAVGETAGAGDRLLFGPDGLYLLAGGELRRRSGAAWIALSAGLAPIADFAVLPDGRLALVIDGALGVYGPGATVRSILMPTSAGAVRAVATDGEGLVFTTADGLYRWDPHEIEGKRLGTAATDLPGADDRGGALAIGPDGAAWTATRAGTIARFTPPTWTAARMLTGRRPLGDLAPGQRAMYYVADDGAGLGRVDFR